MRDKNTVAFSKLTLLTTSGDGGGGGGTSRGGRGPAYTSLATAFVGSTRVEVRCGEFSSCAEGCALVNPSNSALSHGGGLARAIDVAAGPEYVAGLASCAPLRIGTAKVTRGYALSAHGITHVIHTGMFE